MPSEALSLRRARAEDAVEIARLLAGAGLSAWTEEVVSAEAGRSGSELWTAEVGERIEGACLAWIAADEASLIVIAVSPLARRKGIGRALLDAVARAAAARGARELHLEVSAGNEAGRALYDRAGFEQVGLRRGYYADGSDALLLCRTLPAGEAA